METARSSMRSGAPVDAEAEKHVTGARSRRALLEDDAAPPEPTAAVASARPRIAPVLASQCLRDDIAPLEPWGLATRWIDAGAGLVLVGAGAGLIAMGAWSAALPIGLAFAPLTFGIAARRYGARGGGAVVAGGLALVGAVLGPSVGSSLALLAVGAAVATALQFRAVYRASRGARVALAVALAAWAVVSAAVLLLPAGATPLERGLGGASLIVAALGALGFMGEETTGGCAVWSALALAAASLAVGARQLAGGAPLGLATTHAAAALAATTLLALGALRRAACRFAPEQRACVDARGRVRQGHGQGAGAPPT